MTLADCVTRVRTRVEVDLESEVDLTDPHAVVTELMLAAIQVTRKTRVLYEPRAVLTLAAGDQQIDLLSAKCSVNLFRVDGVYINQGWLTFYDQQDFFAAFPDYLIAPQIDHPGNYTTTMDDRVFLDSPISAAGAAAANYARGFREHLAFTWDANKNTQMEGPQAYHLYYVDQAALNLTKSYSSGDEAMQRRQAMLAELKTVLDEEEERNMNAFRIIHKRALAGNKRRVGFLGYGRI